MARERFRHIVLTHPPAEEEFKSPGSGGRVPRIPDWKDRQRHSNFLSRRLQNAWAAAESEQAVAHVTRKGVYLEFKSDPGFDLVTKSLEDRRSKDNQVRLLNVRIETDQVKNGETGALESVDTTYATVFIPHEKKNHFLKKIEGYANKETLKGKPLNSNLINSICDIRKALLVDSFWQDLPTLQPGDDPEWCEVCLSSHAQDVIDGFEVLLTREKIETRPGVVRFPERAVKVIHATLQQLERLTTLSDDIAEYRRAKDTAAATYKNRQGAFVKDLRLRRS